MQPEPVIPQQKKGLAIASLVVGIASVVLLALCGLGPLAGTILGVMALVKANRNPQEYGGKGMAIAGIVLSGLSIFIAGIVAAIALPKLQDALQTGRQTVVVAMLKKVHEAEISYKNTNGKFGTLKELSDAGLIDDSLASGKALGDYIYTSVSGDANGYCIQVTRLNDAAGRRDFNLDQTGAIHFVEAKQKQAVPCGTGLPLLTED